MTERERALQQRLAAAFDALPAADPARLLAQAPRLPPRARRRAAVWPWWLAGALLLGAASAAWWQARQVPQSPPAYGMPGQAPALPAQAPAPPGAAGTAAGEQTAPAKRSPVIHRREATP